MVYKLVFIINVLCFSLVNTLQAQCFDTSRLEKTPSFTLTPVKSSTVEAEHFEGEIGQDWRADGNVVVQHPKMHLKSQKVLGNQAIGEVVLPTAFRLDTPDYSVALENGSYFLYDDRLEGEKGEFFLRYPVSKQFQDIVPRENGDRSVYFRGNMSSIKTPAPKERQLDHVVLTTCPLAKRYWDLSVDRLMINEKTQIGVVDHAVVRIGGLPVFYWPWLNFPLQGQRKSGFLIPYYSRQSSYKTIDYTLSIPYYFNLAPHYDWLLTPKYRSKRGWALDNQIRYLSSNSSGTLLANYQHHDAYQYKANLLSNRYRLYWQHQQTFDYGIKMSIKWNRVSDVDYFKDYDDLIYDPTVINLPIQWQLSGQARNWNWSIAYLDYQRLSANPDRDKPYARKPLIKIQAPTWQISSPKQIAQWRGLFSAEYSQFSHLHRPSIQRAFAYPRLQWRYNTPGYWLNAQWGLHLSNYRIRNNESVAGIDFQSSINRGVPITKIGAGLIFERKLQGEGMKHWTQTLEPKLYWLHIPYRAQSALPLLDTSRSGFKLEQLDVDNLFSGWDRIADTNQITLGLASHIYNKNQRDVLSLELGQRWFFNQWNVLLPGETAPTTKKGDFVLGMRGITDSWRTELKWRFNSQLNKTGSSEGILAYQPDDYRIVGMRYLFKRQPVLPEISILDKTIIQNINLQRTVEGVFSWPLGKGVSFTARNYYSLHDEVYLETHMALRYDTCCMAISLTRSNILLDAEQHYRTNWRIELSLFGFTQLSNRKKVIDRGFDAFKVR